MVNNLVVCGGTFDHFHKGHESFLRHVFSVGKKNIVGITSDKFVRRWKVDGRSWNQIEPFERRKQEVLKFVKKEGVVDRAEIIEIGDLFGPTLSKDLQIDAIVVSDDTRRGAEIINQKRKELGLKDLNILVAPSIYAEDGNLISSVRIRDGEINGMGRLYANPLWFKKDLILPENLRGEFQKPFGELLKDDGELVVDKDNLVITVGDVTTKKFNENFIKQDISVVDFKIARKETLSSLADLGFSGDEKVVTSDNPAGHITSDLFSKVLSIFKSDFDQKIVLEIAGEEDLAVLPLILRSPLNTVIYYGQPNMGLVKVVVSKESKNRIYGLVSKFEPIEIHTRGY